MPTLLLDRVPDPRSRHRPLRPLLLLLALAAHALVAPRSSLSAGELQGAAYWGRSEPADEPGINVLNGPSATFFWEGYRYELSATDTPSAKARSVLEEAIAALAPGLGVECFHRQTAGGWDELPKAGLGDPRAALPSGWSPGEVRLSYYLPPAPGCPSAAADAGLPVVFAGTFQGAGRSLALRAETRLDATKPSPGLFSGVSAGWGEAGWYFEVALDGPEPDEALVAALARALDPALDPACQERLQELSEEQLAASGLPSPQVPEGFAEVSARRTVRTKLGPCASAPPGVGSFDLAWAYTSDDGMLLEIGAARPGQGPESDSKATAADDEGYARWTDAQGISYYVYGHPTNDGPPMEQELVFALARQLDPGFRPPLLPPGP